MGIEVGSARKSSDCEVAKPVRMRKEKMGLKIKQTKKKQTQPFLVAHEDAVRNWK